MLKEKISVLPDNHRDALSADIDAIMYTTEGDVRIYYDDDGMFRIIKDFSHGQPYSLVLLSRHSPSSCGFACCFSIFGFVFIAKLCIIP